MISEICGITPETRTLRRNTSPYAPSDTTPSWMRAPPESLMPITGQPILAARSMILHIFSAITSPSDPEHGEVLAEHAHRAAVDRAVPGHDGIAPGPLLVHLELVGAVPDEGV